MQNKLSIKWFLLQLWKTIIFYSPSYSLCYMALCPCIPRKLPQKHDTNIAFKLTICLDNTPTINDIFPIPLPNQSFDNTKPYLIFTPTGMMFASSTSLPAPIYCAQNCKLSPWTMTTKSLIETLWEWIPLKTINLVLQGFPDSNLPPPSAPLQNVSA